VGTLVWLEFNLLRSFCPGIPVFSSLFNSWSCGAPWFCTCLRLLASKQVREARVYIFKIFSLLVWSVFMDLVIE